MKITFERLCEIFRVRDDRQLRVNLAGKMVIINQDTVRITDKRLKRLFNDLEDDIVITMAEASKLYNETEPNLQFLANNGYVDFFKLAPDKRGSKILFQKSKLDEYFITDINYSKKERSRSEKRELEQLIISSCLAEKEAWKEVMIDFHVKFMSVTEIAIKNKVSTQAIRLKLRLRIN